MLPYTVPTFSVNQNNDSKCNLIKPLFWIKHLPVAASLFPSTGALIWAGANKQRYIFTTSFINYAFNASGSKKFSEMNTLRDFTTRKKILVSTKRENPLN